MICNWSVLIVLWWQEVNRQTNSGGCAAAPSVDGLLRIDIEMDKRFGLIVYNYIDLEILDEIEYSSDINRIYTLFKW